MKSPQPDRSLLFLRARFMEEEALGAVASPLGRRRPLPKMAPEELIDQALRFKAVTWVQAPDGELHKVGLAHNGQLAFSHHTMREVRRYLAFEELGGEVCNCVRYLRAFDCEGAWWPLPPHFRREVNLALARRKARRPPPDTPKPPPKRSAWRVSGYRARYTRVSGRRAYYE